MLTLTFHRILTDDQSDYCYDYLAWDNQRQASNLPLLERPPVQHLEYLWLHWFIMETVLQTC